jgi:hypothetical protein
MTTEPTARVTDPGRRTPRSRIGSHRRNLCRPGAWRASARCRLRALSCRTQMRTMRSSSWRCVGFGKSVTRPEMFSRSRSKKNQRSLRGAASMRLLAASVRTPGEPGCAKRRVPLVRRGRPLQRDRSPEGGGWHALSRKGRWRRTAAEAGARDGTACVAIQTS